MAALAEAGWNAAVAKDESLFKTSLKAHLNFYKQAGIYYFDPFNPSLYKEAIDIAPLPVVKD
jgi:hexosaminidase